MDLYEKVSEAMAILSQLKTEVLNYNFLCKKNAIHDGAVGLLMFANFGGELTWGKRILLAYIDKLNDLYDKWN